MTPAKATLPKAAILRMALLTASGMVAIYVAFLMEPRDQMVAVQGKLGYWATATTCIFAVLAVLLKIRAAGLRPASLPSLVKRHLAVLALIPVLVFGALSLAPPKFRILGDEAKLLGVSLAMYETHENVLWTQGVYLHGSGYQPAAFQYDKRAPGYPFLLSTSYEFTGYRYQNAFMINAISGALVLLLTYVLAWRHFGKTGGITAVLTLASFPVFWYSVGSSGFETPNLMFLLLGLLLAGQLDRSRSWVDVMLLVAVSSMVGLFRYESVLVASALFLLVLYRAPRHQLASMPWLLTLAPLAYVATGWQVFVPFSTEVPADIEAFSVTNLIANIEHAVRFLGNLGATESSSPLAFFAAVAALPLLLRPTGLKALMGGPNRFLTGLMGLTCLAWLITVLCYWHGNFENTITMRLCLPLLPLIAIATAFGLDQLSRATGKNGVQIILATVMVALTLPALARVNDHRKNESSAFFNAAAQLLDNRYSGQNVLVVTDGAAWFSALQVGAVGFGSFDSNAEQFLALRRAGILDEIIVAEFFDGSGKQPRARNFLYQPLPITSLLTLQLGPDTVLRMTSVDVTPLADK